MGLAGIVGEVEVEGPRLREVVRTLHELRMMRATGQLPAGKAWTEQVAWKMELWAAWWMAADGE